MRRSCCGRLGQRSAFLGTATLSFLTVAILVATPASASSPWWKLTANMAPSSIPRDSEGRITITATNLGDASVQGGSTRVTVQDVLPPGLTATAIRGYSGRGPDEGLTFKLREYGEVKCALETVSCSYGGTLPPFEPLKVEVTVRNTSAEAEVYSEVLAEGGGAPSARLHQSIPTGSAATGFGIASYELVPEEEGGSTDTQAGSHPFQLTTALSFETALTSTQIEGAPVQVAKPTELMRNLELQLPPGLVGNPTAVAQCTEEQFSKVLGFVNQCPGSTAIGVASVTFSMPGAFQNVPRTVAVPVFNLVPRAGEPARFGFEVYEVPVFMDTEVRSGGDYGVTVTVRNSSEKAALLSSNVTLWGVPGDPRHDVSRGWACLGEGVWAESTTERCGFLPRSNAPAFLTMPTSCLSQRSVVSVNSWSSPGYVRSQWPLDVEGCEELPFTPSIDVGIAGHAASSPTGLTLSVHVPQETTVGSTALAESDMEGVTMVLPAGMKLNPSAADGLSSCAEAQVGFEAVGAATGVPLFANALSECPDESKVANVSIETPLLPHELQGAIYLATQYANPFGSLVALYLVAEDRGSGVRVKLPGNIKLDERTGQITAAFAKTPQLPFEDLTVEFFGEARAPLSTPADCGVYAVSGSFSPWSGDASVPASAPLTIDSGPGGAPCAKPRPFAPSLSGGTLSAKADSFSPLVLSLAREDSNQELNSVELHMPPGLLASLASVVPCPEPQASDGSCGPGSEIGTVEASVGLGPAPYRIRGGKVFLTGPYEGAPFGLTVTVPAKTGPFDLGSGRCDCVIVRARIDVNPQSAAVTIAGDRLPTILRGIPIELKRLDLSVDRLNFISTPTNCAAMALSATLTGIEGVRASVGSLYQVANCATLPFKPTLAADVIGKTSRLAGAALHVHVSATPGQANIAKVAVKLPKQLPSRLSTLQKACAESVFDVNPAHCPSGSVVGAATAVTPILRSRLAGPAYLVSHGGQAFPDLEVVLQGEGITLILDGNTDIRKGVTSTTFRSLPDAPIRSFDLVLPQGSHSALGAVLPRKAHGSLCGQRLVMPTTITGQNGAVVRQSTRVAVSGCSIKHCRVHRPHRRTRRK